MSGTRKRLFAHLLLLLGLLLSGAGLIVAYLTRTVLDEGAFSARLVSALHRPAVATFVASQIADGVIAANRDLTAFKPVITTLAEGLVKSAPFQAIAGRGAREAHRVAFSQGAERVMLSVPDVGVMLRSTLQALNPDVAARVPADLRTVSTVVTGKIATRVLTVMRLLHQVRDYARWGLALGLVLMLVAVAISPVRRQTMLNAAIGLLALAAVLALLVPLGRAVVTGSVSDPAIRLVVGEVWTTFANGFLPWAVGVAAGALMVMAASAAFLAPSQLRRLASRAWEEIRGRQPTTPREILRLGFLVAVGAIAVADPLGMLRAFAVVSGLVILAIAMYEAISFIAPEHEAGDSAAIEPLRLSPALPMAAGVLTLVVAGLGTVALVPRLRAATAPPVAVTTVRECNGWSQLCDRPFDQVIFAGAHNAMGSSDDPHWLFPNQDASITRLLDRGVRALLIDVTRGHPVGDKIKTDFDSEDQRRKFEQVIGTEAFSAAMRIRDRLIGASGETGLYLCHGFCELGATPFDTALAHLKQFLDAHPGEVVLVVIEDRASPAEIMEAFERQGLGGLVYQGPWGTSFPTLGDMIASGRRLVVLGENVPDTTSWYRPAYSLMQETPYTFHKPEDFSCRPNRGAAANPLFLMNHWIESTPAPKPSNAKIVNAEAFLVARARECRRVRGRMPTVLAVDFAATGDVVRAAALLNGLVNDSL